MSSENSTAHAGSERPSDVLLPFLTVVGDAAAIEAAFLLSYWLRFRTTIFEGLGFLREDAPPLDVYLASSLVVIVVWLSIFHARRMYAPRRAVELSDELFNVVRVVTLGMLIVLSAAFFYRGFSYSRVAFLLLWIFAIVFVFASRAGLHAYERSLYRRGRHLRYAVIVGDDPVADEVYRRLDRHSSFGFAVLGYFARSPLVPGRLLARARYFGSFGDAAGVIRQLKIPMVFIAVGRHDHSQLLDLIADCEGMNAEFMMVPDNLEVVTSRLRIRELEGIPFLTVKSIPLTPWGRISKLAFDLTVAGAITLLLFPLGLLVALLIRLDSPGSVLFRQRRIGLDGREFTMMKFRSMRAGAEAMDNLAGLGIKDDPRRTRIGRFLRATSLDELPQLINVLRGHMSLVGPRPERTQYVENFREIVPKYLDRHRVKAGVTGWAQVNGLRGDTSIEERISYDLYYIENWSLTFDIKILLRTIRASFRTREP